MELDITDPDAAAHQIAAASMEQTSYASMDSPTRPSQPPPTPPTEPLAPSSPPSQSQQHPAADPSLDEPLSSENPTPAPAPSRPGPTTPSPPHRSGDSSPTSPPHSSDPPPPTSTDPSPPHLPSEAQTSPATRPTSPLSTGPPPSPPPPAPASSGARSEHEEAESLSEAGSMTLALALTKTAESVPSTPPKASSAEASPVESPCKDSAVTIAKLLSGEDPATAETKPEAEKVIPPSDNGKLTAAAVTTAGRGSVGSKRWLLGRGVPEKVRHAELRRAELGFRVSAAVFCLIALSVMAADTTTGWSGDSFRRHNEYRYVLAVSVVAFTYSGFQLVAEVHYLVTGRRIIRAPFHSYFSLAMDQILAYLLLSASSAALSRNDVWISRFGGDQFTKLVNASASMAFLAFIALGLSSVISCHYVFRSVS